MKVPAVAVYALIIAMFVSLIVAIVWSDAVDCRDSPAVVARAMAECRRLGGRPVLRPYGGDCSNGWELSTCTF